MSEQINTRIEKEFDDLRLEIGRHHPLLLIATDKAKNIMEFLEIVALDCNIMVDGAYSREKFLELAQILTKKLQDRRAIIITK